METALPLIDKVDPLLRRKRFTPASLSAFLHASEALALSLGRKLGAMRDSGDSFQVYVSRIAELEHQTRTQSRVIALHQARMRRLLLGKPDDYEPTERWEILQVRRESCLTQLETAKQFLVSLSTIARWEREARNRPDQAGHVGSLLKALPPVVRVADAVRGLIQLMSMMGFGGSGTIARWVYRAGYEVSRAFVQNVLDEPPVAPLDALSVHVTPPPLREKATRRVTARHPMHVVMADVTDIPRSLGGTPIKLFAFYDVFSRMPLAWRLLEKDPSAEDAIALFDEVVAKYGPPTHFVCDRGSYFTAQAFQKRLEELGVKVRFGALGQHGSIALIERFWKSLKALLDVSKERPLSYPLTLATILPRVENALAFYSHFRPHMALGGAAPAEIFYGLSQPQLSAVPAPRGSPGDPCPDLRVTITFLDSERFFPVLLRKAA